jgi:hypothetical protein
VLFLVNWTCGWWGSGNGDGDGTDDGNGNGNGNGNDNGNGNVQHSTEGCSGERSKSLQRLSSVSGYDVLCNINPVLGMLLLLWALP